ncbi:MAG: acyl carrier protein [Deltaproteobacteria bacterium]|nr:MAG: acyl carrier protein [Deltaproteobacteria bacterium]
MASAAPDRDPTAVLDTVARLLREVIGEDWVDEVEITMDTSFSDDLELESIEFVALAEQLQETYGDRVDFVGWLSSMDLDEIIGLRVGQLVDFIVQCPPS